MQHQPPSVEVPLVQPILEEYSVADVEATLRQLDDEEREQKEKEQRRTAMLQTERLLHNVLSNGNSSAIQELMEAPNENAALTCLEMGVPAVPSQFQMMQLNALLYARIVQNARDIRQRFLATAQALELDSEGMSAAAGNYAHLALVQAHLHASQEFSARGVPTQAEAVPQHHVGAGLWSSGV